MKIDFDQSPPNYTKTAILLFAVLVLIFTAVRSVGEAFSYEAKARAEVLTAQAQALVAREFETNQHLATMNRITEGKAQEAAATFAAWQSYVRVYMPFVALSLFAAVSVAALGLSAFIGGWGIGAGAAGLAFGGRAMARMVYEWRRALAAPVVTPVSEDGRWVVVNRQVISTMTGRISQLEAGAQESKLIAQANNAQDAIHVAGELAQKEANTTQALDLIHSIMRVMTALKAGKQVSKK